MDKKIVYQSLLGLQKLWRLTVYEDENKNLIPEISRPDGQFFRVAFITEGYDRPIIENFGPSKVAVVVDESGAVAVEPENVLLSA